MPLAAFEPDPADARRLGWWILALALLPTLIAIWFVPWFVTQDGPAHLYNAHIIAASLRPDSPFRDVFQVRWDPLPNWAGHLTLIGLMTILPPRAADRAMMTITLVGFAASILWLRWRVAGGRGIPLAAVMAALLALNAAWLFGFTSFLLGACLFPITLGVWWGGRERMGPVRALALAGLLVLGYFCHLISLGLTVVGLVVLVLTTPGPKPVARGLWTLGSLLFLVPLGITYRRLMQTGGTLKPEWGQLKNPWSLASWGSQLGWVDPLSLGSKMILPFVEVRSYGCGLVAPVLWFSLALLLLLAATLLRPAGASDAPNTVRDRRGWALLAGLLVLGGVLGPDTFGEGHGNYMPQRVLLLGLAAVVPFLKLDGSRWLVRAGGAALVFALAMQSAYAWDYALHADRTAGIVVKAKPFVGRNQRVGTLLVGIRGHYRANPLLHIDSILGIGTGNIIWSNYETTHYYFPVQIRDPERHPPAAEFEAVALLEGPENAAERTRRWGRLIEGYHNQIDTLVVWGSDPALDALNARWYEPRVQIGNVRVLRHRGGTSRGTSPP